MKKFEFGLFALCVLVGGYIGSLFGMAVAVCAFMTVDGLIDEFIKRNRQKHKDEKKEEASNA
jgi:hypothetical protein